MIGEKLAINNRIDRRLNAYSPKLLTIDKIDNGVKANKISGMANIATKIHVHIFCILFISISKLNNIY